MNFLHRTLRDHLDDKQKAVMLLSGTCKGNDPQLPFCPLLHGSLGPMLFSHIDSESRTETSVIDDATQVKLQALLINSHNITWVKHIYFPFNETLCKRICDTLSKTRYSSRSIKSVRCNSCTLSISVPFIKSHCQVVEEFRDIVDFQELKDTHLQLLSQLNCIKRLDLSENEDRTDDSLRRLLSKFSSLQYLNLSDCCEITDDGLDHLSKLSSLLHLDVRRCNEITDAGLVYISKLSSLKHLDLAFCGKVTNDGVALLSCVLSLQYLNLSWCDISDDSLVHVSKLTSLQHLSFAGCKEITDDGLLYLSTLSSLQELDLHERKRFFFRAIEIVIITRVDIKNRKCVWKKRSL